MRAWADAEDKPDGKYRDAHVWYDVGSKQNFTAYKLLFTDVIDGRMVAVPRAITAAGNIMQGSRGGIDLPESDIPGSRTTSRSTTRKWARQPPGSGTDGAFGSGPAPIMATFLITALHWDQAKALAGQDRRPPQFGLRLKRRDPCPRLRA